MIVDEQADALKTRIENFERKLAEFEQMLMTMCSRTEQKIDQVLETLTEIHDRVINQHPNIEHEYDSEPEASDKENEMQSDDSESDYESASLDISGETVDR